MTCEYIAFFIFKPKEVFIGCRARVAARPSGTDSKWVEQDAAAGRRGAGTGERARGDGSGAGARLVSRERVTFRARGSPLPHGKEGATVDFLLRDTRASRVRTPTCLSGCGGSRRRAGERAGAELIFANGLQRILSSPW